jgi:hypothetical protein
VKILQPFLAVREDIHGIAVEDRADLLRETPDPDPLTGICRLHLVNKEEPFHEAFSVMVITI